MKRSAGVLAYKIEDDKLKVLLCHFGGPFWENEKYRAWSIPKGELEYKEKTEDAARREFEEETNLNLTTDIKYLCSRKVNPKKLVTMFYTESDFDLSNCKSNTFELEFPKNSGKIGTYPEMDGYSWMDIEEASKVIITNQLYFLDKLKNKVTI